MMELAMRTMLVNLSRLLKTEDVDNMKYLCKDFIPLRKREDITTSINLFNELEQRGKLKYNDVSFLGYLLNNACADRSEVLHAFSIYSGSRDYMAVSVCGLPQNQVLSDSEPVSECGYWNIISRSGWGALAPISVSYITHMQPLHYVIIQHSADSQCHDRSSSIENIRRYQRYHMGDLGWQDIGYSFVIGGDGSIFEARGWDREGAHTRGYNDKGLGICIMGNFQLNRPKQVQMDAAQYLIKYGISLGKISPDYILLGHRDVRDTISPGDKLYAIIREWSHYVNNH